MADIGYFLAWVAIAGFLFLGLMAVLELLVNLSVKQMARKTRPLPPRERDLLGDDYRECVADYFSRKQTRREIVREVAGVGSPK
jgi:hypothetical protein